MDENTWSEQVADRLATLYASQFGGKTGGRYRISAKLVRRLAGRRRLYESDLRDLSRALFEKEFVLIDMDSFFVVMSAHAFTNYRRVSEDCVDL